MKILITGSAGFIGFHLSKFFLNKGYNVIGIDFLNSKSKKIQINRNKILKKSKTYKFLNLDLSKKNICKKKISNINYVFHLAAQPGVRKSMTHVNQCIKSNIISFNNILEFLRYNKIKNLYYASSSSVYGELKKGFNEKYSADNLNSNYALSKQLNEKTANLYYREYGINSIGLRFFSIYGPYGREDMAYYRFCLDILKNKKIFLNGNGNIKRSFTYIDDAISIIYRLFNNFKTKKKFNEVFNVGIDENYKISELINIISKNYTSKFKVLKKPTVKADNKLTLNDSKKTQKIISFKPKINLNNGMKSFLIWFKDYYKIND